MFGSGASASFLDSALALAARTQARKAYQRFLREAREAVGRQQRVLLDLLRCNAQSDFGRRHDFDRIRSTTDFRSAVPIRDYEAIRPDIEQVMEGHERALFGPSQRVLMFAMTSGSTDKPKYIPVTRQFVREFRRGWNVFGGKALLDHPQAFLRPILQVTSPLDVERTACGLPCGAISGLLAREQPRIVRRYYAAPPEVAQIPDAPSRYYTIMRFALPRDVAWIVTASPATPLKLARTAAAHADRLIRDIHDGTLSPPQPIACQAAQILHARLKPDPQTASRLESIVAKSGALLPRDYWGLAFLANWTGGTLALHLQDFPAYYGDTPIRDIGLLATEGRVSIGITSGTSAGVLDVAAGFFEFAEDGAAGGENVKQCHELDVGGVYRVILTNSAGLYRYDIGDCVRVAGYQGQAPLLEFLHRGSRISSMTGEKLSEWQVTTAMRNVAMSLGKEISCFVLAPVWSDPPYYRLFLEGAPSEGNDVSRRFDAELAHLNIEYAGKRSSGRLGPVQVRPLASELFEQWERKRMETNRSGEQYKQQYLFTAPGEDRVLLAAAEPTDTPPEPDRDMPCREAHPPQTAHR